jgi:4'-phosphopantetheinyl transferase
VHRWLARGEHEIPSTDDWLSERESAYLTTLRFTKRRTEYLLRRWVGKHAVAATAGLATAPADLARVEVANRPSGAPYVLVDGRPSGVEVSLTDRAGWAVCLVGADLGRVGCDLEIVEPRSAGFVTDFLTAPEQAYVAAQPDGDAAANLLWSAKESALKVLRTGLRRDTRSVEVEVSDPGPAGWGGLEVRPTEGAALPGWWRREGVFLLTVCSDRAFPPPVVLDSSAELSTAEPVHSWVEHPLAD